MWLVSLCHPGGGRICEKIPVSPGQGAACGQSSWSAFVTRGVVAFARRSCLCWSGSRSRSIFLVSLRHPGGGRICEKILFLLVGEPPAVDLLVGPSSPRWLVPSPTPSPLLLSHPPPL